MATYVNDLRLKEIATGDESGTWGTSTNTNLELIAEAFSFGTEAITTNADTHTTTIADGSTDPGRSLYLKYTGTLDSACTITLGPNTVSKLWFIENGTSGSQNIIISQGSGANVTIPNGHVKAVYSDGAGSGAAIVDAFTDLNVAGVFTSDGGIAVDNITIDGTEIDLSSGDLTIDVAGDIILDAAGDNWLFNKSGTTLLNIQKDGDNVEFISSISDGDMKFRGNDGGSTINALTLDMSDAGTAQFNNRVAIGGSPSVAQLDIRASNSSKYIYCDDGTNALLEIKGSTSELTISSQATGFSAHEDIHLKSHNLMFYQNGSEKGRFDSSGNFLVGTTTAIDSDSGRGNISLNGSSAAMFNLGVGGSQKGYFFHNGSFLRISNTVSDGIMQFQTNDTERMQIDSAGLISMTHSASAHTGGLSIINSQAGGFGSALTFQSERSDDNSIVSAAQIRTQGQDSWNSAATADSNLFFATSLNGSITDKMTIKHDGSVGIGTTAPEELLHVSTGSTVGIRASGGGNSARKIEIGYDNTNGPYVKGGSSGVTSIQFYVDNTTLAGKFDTNADFYTNDGTVHSLSDSRVKTDINDLIDGLDIVKQLQPKTFKYNEKSEFYSEETKDEVRYGFVADEVQEVAPQYMQVGKGRIDGVEVDDLKTLSTTKMIPMLVKAIQEQQEQIDALQSEINLLKGE